MSTGHAHHFLSRLDRVSMPHVELALSLYRDDALLKYVLECANVPEGVERVAIALEDSPTSPYIVVTRAGRFVTCLGEGMATDLHVIPRARLDALSNRLVELRTRIENAKTYAGPRGGVGKLLQRIYDAGDELSREEMVALGGLQPLFAFEFFRSLFSVTADLADSRDVLVRQLKRAPKLKPAFHAAARAYWKAFWAIGHFSVLAGMSGPEVYHSLPDELRDMLSATSFSWSAVRQGISSLALRGVWAVARIGKVSLPPVKAMFHRAFSDLTVIDSGMCLVALGARHSRLRAETRKALEAGPTPTGDEYIDSRVRGICKVLAGVAERDGTVPEEQIDEMVELGAAMVVEAGEGAPAGSPYAFTKPEDVPRELALAQMANLQAPFIGYSKIASILATTFIMVPWVARAAPEDLYLPDSFLRGVRRPWTPEHTTMLLEAQRLHYKPATVPVRAEVSRQGPCPCGSGKKYKRCCEGTA